eukprot:SAG31_NODE_1291_length_8975_cov_26.197274_8_plen_148_part_00
MDVTKIFNDVGQTYEFITARDAMIQAQAATHMNATLETSHAEDAESDFNNAMRMLGSYMIPTMQRQVDQLLDAVVTDVSEHLTTVEHVVEITQAEANSAHAEISVLEDALATAPAPCCEVRWYVCYQRYRDLVCGVHPGVIKCIRLD